MRFFTNLFNVSDGQLKKYASSTFWMILEKVLRLTVNLIVGIWLARYLGPSEFGVYNFAIAITVIMLPIVNFGLQGILVKELYQSPNKREVILGSAIFFKCILSLVVVLLIFAGAVYGLFENKAERLVIVLTSLSILFHPFLTIETWYESQVKVRKISIFKSFFFILGSTLKIVFILKKATIFTFALLYTVESFLIAMALLMVYFLDNKKRIQWKFNRQTLRYLTSKSWLLVLSSFSAVLYLKIDQVMLGVMTTDRELGYYSAAVKISESWYFVPLIISNALFPAILEARSKSNKHYIKRLQQLCDFYFLISFSLALVVAFLADLIINLTYGQDYIDSAYILKIHIWAGIFIFLRSVLSKWLIAEEKYRFSLISQFSGAVMNIVLNLILIPFYGAVGAAIATVISYMVTSVLILGFFKETKGMFKIFINSFTAPLRLLLKL